MKHWGAKVVIVVSVGCSLPACSSSGGSDIDTLSTGSMGSDATDTSGSDGGDGEPMLDVGMGSGSGGDDGNGGGGEPIETCEDAAMVESNLGCEFWAVDLPNAWQVNLSPAAEAQPYAIVITNVGDEPADVAIYAGNQPSAIESGVVAGGSLEVFTFGNALGVPNRMNSTGLAYRIESDRPITAYQFNPLDNSTQVYSNDASLLFPTHVLREDYTAITGDGMFLGPLGDYENAGAFITVVAGENDTSVTVFPTPGVPMYSGSMTATLDRGQAFTVMSNAVTSLFQNDAGQGNLSGSRVEATKPVAVFSGNVASFEPTPQMGCCADHLEHQMLPLSAWGDRYVVTTAAPNDGSTDDPVQVRIVGSFDNTSLSYAPSMPAGAPASLDAYEVATFTADASFVVSGDQPFAVAQFLLSNERITVDPTPDDDADNGTWPGDPAMILVPPIDQLQQDYVFFVPAEYQVNYVTVVRPAGAPVSLDDQEIGATASWLEVGELGGTTWERAHVELGFGQHRISTTDLSGIAITVAGYSPAVSFGYAGGSGAAFIKAPPPAPVP